MAEINAKVCWIVTIITVVFMTLLLNLGCYSANTVSPNTDGMQLPELNIGDTWTWASRIDRDHLELTYKVVGEDKVEGQSCYVIQASMVPSPPGIIGEQIMMLSNQTLDVIRMQSQWESGDGSIGEETVTLSYSYSESPYPLNIGKVWEVIKTEEDIASWREEPLIFESSSRYEVQCKEDITVAAGSFKCFKVVRYDHGSDQPSNITWLSDETKYLPVKWEDMDDAGNVMELNSYYSLGD